VEPDRGAWDAYVGTYAGPRDAVRVTRAGDRLLAEVAGGDILAIAEALGPGEGREAELVPAGADAFVLLGPSTLLDESPAAFVPGPDGRLVLVVGGEPIGVRQ
jgi:hypothetical protein